jgi:NDP-sugar pyrophosphorylase family protein
VLGHENIFIEEGAKLEFVTLNALSGPIYIGKDAEIMEGSVIRGPLHCVKKMAAKVYSHYSRTSFQNWRRVNNLLFQLIRTKGMMVLGNSVLGEWCNIGADNNSNLKNNYEEVKLWVMKQKVLLKLVCSFVD